MLIWSLYSCRVYNLPFYIGLIVPFVLVYIFNWVMFVLIIASLVRATVKSRLSESKDGHHFMTLRQHLIIAMTLSVLFGLGWGTGVAASYNTYSTTTKYILSTLFICCTAFDGVFIFIMHCVRSKDIRTLWRGWLKRTKVEDMMSSFITHSVTLRRTVRATVRTRRGKKDRMTTPIVIKNETFTDTGQSEMESRVPPPSEGQRVQFEESVAGESSVNASDGSGHRLSAVEDNNQSRSICVHSESEHTLEKYKV